MTGNFTKEKPKEKNYYDTSYRPQTDRRNKMNCKFRYWTDAEKSERVGRKHSHLPAPRLAITIAE